MKKVKGCVPAARRDRKTLDRVRELEERVANLETRQDIAISMLRNLNEIDRLQQGQINAISIKVFDLPPNVELGKPDIWCSQTVPAGNLTTETE